ncbi:MAG: energy transducer TonB [Xanthomonadaceae bacterium]|jgi:protein TonB|nr:energy transducer TonB [Xanthomonadaceae bacterium]
MTEELVIHRHYDDEDDGGQLSWARIVGIAFVIALHVAVLLLLLIPAVAPKAEQPQERKIVVNLVDAKPPPPPPPPPPPKPEDRPPPPIRTLAPPRTTPPPMLPPPEAPPVDVADPRPTDVYVEPTPPVQPQVPRTIEAGVDPSSRRTNPPQYPPAALRAGVEGQVVLLIDIDENGNVLNVTVERNTSRNHDLERAAVAAARKWTFNPRVVNGKREGARVRVPVDFNLGR